MATEPSSEGEQNPAYRPAHRHLAADLGVYGVLSHRLTRTPNPAKPGQGLPFVTPSGGMGPTESDPDRTSQLLELGLPSLLADCLALILHSTGSARSIRQVVDASSTVVVAVRAVWTGGVKPIIVVEGGAGDLRTGQIGICEGDPTQVGVGEIGLREVG
jgi:hypothetical protein